MTTSRRVLATILTVGLLAAPLAAAAQLAGKVYRVGFLRDTPAVWPHALESFRQGLRDLGWVEGRNLVIEYRWAEGRFERLPLIINLKTAKALGVPPSVLARADEIIQ